MDEALKALAEEALITAHGNWEQARKLLFTRLMENRVLYEAHVVPLVREAVRNIVHYVGRQSRTPVRLGNLAPLQETQPTSRLQQGRTLLAIDNLMNYPLLGGHKVLGDATKDELLAQSAWYLKNARSMRVTGRWLALVAEKLANSQKTVRRVLTEEQLREMHAQAQREAA